MKLEALGCSGNITKDKRTTAYLVNDHVLFDAGTVTDSLTPDRFGAITHVFLSHIHLDHVIGLCSLAEELSMRDGRSVTVMGVRTVLEELRRFVFNSHLWPDFTVIPESTEGAVRLRSIHPGKYENVGNVLVKAIPVNHRISTTGFIVQEADKAFMITSDTGATDELWAAARHEEDLEFIIAHVAFPSRLSTLAKQAGHMTPSVLFERIDAFDLRSVVIYVSHIKSTFEREILDEIEMSGRPNIRILQQGTTLAS